MKISAVIVAAGKGRRMGAGINKVYLEILGKSVLEHTVAAFEACDKIDEITVVTDDLECCRGHLDGFSKVKHIVLGGETRSESVKNGLSVCDGDYVLIHDGARALIQNGDIENVIDAVKAYGAAAVGVKCKDTLKLKNADGFIEKTVDREMVYQIQTPQAFVLSEISEMYEKMQGDFTDDCALAESFGKKIKLVDGSYDNIKITTPDDLQVAEKILEKRGEKNENRSGL